MKRVLYLAALILAVRIASGQNTLSEPDTPRTTIRSTSTLVVVPTLVRTASGTFVTGLGEKDFRLTDNGVEQKISVEQEGPQPLAVVVLMQTGGTAARQFKNYHKIGAFIEAMMRSPAYKVAMVTFDSRPEEIWNFPPKIEGVMPAFQNPQGGDHGAAIIDAVNCGLDLFQQQPEELRRVILLLSQSEDEGSKIAAEDLIRRLGESNATVYSITFAAKKMRTKNQLFPSSQVKQTSPMSFDNAALQPSEPFGTALNAMRENAAAETAILSGGEQIRFDDDIGLDSRLSILANDIPNGYTLSFRPSSNEPGFHILNVQIKEKSMLEVTARASYWTNDMSSEK